MLVSRERRYFWRLEYVRGSYGNIVLREAVKVQYVNSQHISELIYKKLMIEQNRYFCILNIWAALYRYNTLFGNGIMNSGYFQYCPLIWKLIIIHISLAIRSDHMEYVSGSELAEYRQKKREREGPVKCGPQRHLLNYMLRAMLPTCWRVDYITTLSSTKKCTPLKWKVAEWKKYTLEVYQFLLNK